MKIKLNEDQRDFTRFLWYKSPQDIVYKNFENNELVEYRMNTILFGINASPFATLRHCIKKANDLEFENKLINSLHIDDLNAGEISIPKAVEFVDKAKEHFIKASFNLLKFQSKSKELEKIIQSKYGEKENPMVEG